MMQSQNKEKRKREKIRISRQNIGKILRDEKLKRHDWVVIKNYAQLKISLMVTITRNNKKLHKKKQEDMKQYMQN